MKRKDVYEKVCEESIDSLYRAAYLALGDADAAAQAVTETCVACVHLCEGLRESADIQTVLLNELSARCAQKLSHPLSGDCEFPEKLRTVEPTKRLRLAMRLAAVREI